MIEPQTGSFLPDHAKYVLSLDFTDAEQAQYQELASKASEGTLSAEDKLALDDFVTANTILMILQSKARKSLNQSTTAA